MTLSTAPLAASSRAPKGAKKPLEYITKSTVQNEPKKPAQTFEKKEKTPPRLAPQKSPENGADIDGQFFRDTPPDSAHAPIFRRFHLLKTAATLLPDERVSKCLAYLRPDAAGVEVLANTAEKRAKYAQLTRCGSVYMCPVCGSKIAQERNREVKLLLQGCRHYGYFVYMVTLTIPHSRNDDPLDLRSRLSAATSTVFGSKAWRAWCKSLGFLGMVRAVEVTHSEANGFHPHIHALMIFETPTYDQARNMRRFIYDQWAAAAVKHGFDRPSYAHGVNITRTDWDRGCVVNEFGDESFELGDYISKLGGWGDAEELTLSNRKKAKKGGRSPAQLLSDAANGDERAGYLFQQYAKAFKGFRVLVWSRFLKKTFHIQEQTDQEIADKSVDSGYSLLTTIPLSKWYLVLRSNSRGYLLSIASKGDIAKFNGALSLICAT